MVGSKNHKNIPKEFLVQLNFVSRDPHEVPRTCMCTPWGPNGGMFSKTKWSRSLSLKSSEVYGSSLRSYSTQENYTDTYTSLHDVVHPMWKCKKVGRTPLLPPYSLDRKWNSKGCLVCDGRLLLLQCSTTKCFVKEHVPVAIKFYSQHRWFYHILSKEKKVSLSNTYTILKAPSNDQLM